MDVLNWPRAPQSKAKFSSLRSYPSRGFLQNRGVCSGHRVLSRPYTPALLAPHKQHLKGTHAILGKSRAHHAALETYNAGNRAKSF